MKKVRSKYVCQSCGYESLKWMGKCSECGSWNSFIEEVVESQKEKRKNAVVIKNRPLSITKVSQVSEKRLITGIEEFDRVVGGGIVLGSVNLLGGAPGIGKSTLLLQACAHLANQGKKVLYVSGEESLSQIKMRADRLSIHSDHFFLLAETDADTIVAVLKAEKPDMAVIDSIQTVFTSDLESLPGNVSQVRFCGHAITVTAKEEHIPLFLIGHVTKDGSIAGPRVLEHLVDGLLLFEGDGQYDYRILRAVKNRFGSTNEIGLFEMSDRGMVGVNQPSEFLLAQRRPDISGTVVTVHLEGTRSFLVEVQALVTPTRYGIPQRTTTGIDSRRLAILLAVLEKRLGLPFGNQDVFVNAAGGLRLTEPGVDLAVALALISSLKEKPIDAKIAVVGEIGLGSEIRTVSQIEKRISEAERLGFKQFIYPKNNQVKKSQRTGIRLMGMESLNQVVNYLFK
ncbi:DNA repair protein RadA [bacterium]|nr:DNA repair protein RadA [bacterium]